MVSSQGTLQLVCGHIAAQRSLVIDLQERLTSFQATGPESGGPGEWAKAAYLEQRVRALGITDIRRVNSPDVRVAEGKRPNLAAVLPGHSPRTLWIMGHMDVVPPGDASLWHTDPWKVVVQGDTLIGRGVEDNQQAIVGGLLVAEALYRQGVTPDLSLGLLFVADEECGNAHGIHHVLEVMPGLVKPDDLVLVPDSGSADSTWMEVAEKGVLWLKVTVQGEQCHASRPGSGRNSLVAAARMITAVATVAARFAEEDPLFMPPVSTMSPTRHEENVPNVNTIPGRDVFYVDCRLLPQHDNGVVRAAFEETFATIAAQHGVTVQVDETQNHGACAVVPADSEVVRRLAANIMRVYGVTPHCVGIGGGTVAATFRNRGIPAVVWSTLQGSAHLANESALISNTLRDAEVFAGMLFDESLCDEPMKA